MAQPANYDDDIVTLAISSLYKLNIIMVLSLLFVNVV